MPARNQHRREHRRMARDDPDFYDDEMDERRNTSSEDEYEDEGECGATDANNSTSLVHINPAVSSLVETTAQQMGLPYADGTAFALAAMQQDRPEDALRLLAAASAKANIDTQYLRAEQGDISDRALHAKVLSEEATDGLRNSDVTYDNRYKRQNQINDQLDEISNSLQEQNIALNVNNNALREELIALREEHTALQEEHTALREEHTALREEHTALQLRTARLEGMLARVITMLMNNSVDANQIAEMLRELSI